MPSKGHPGSPGEPSLGAGGRGGDGGAGGDGLTGLTGLTGHKGADGARGARGAIGDPGITRAMFKRWRRNVLIGYILIIVGAGFTYETIRGGQHDQNHNANVQCERANESRHTSNVAIFSFRTFLNNEVTALNDLIVAERANITIPKVVLAAKNESRKEAAAKDAALAAQLRWIPLSFCSPDGSVPADPKVPQARAFISPSLPNDAAGQ